MKLRTLTRASAIGALASAAAASWLTFVIEPANALEQERIVIRRDEVVDLDFQPIAGSNPANEAIDPETCRLSAYCDTVPLTVEVPPDISEDDEYFIQILLTWDSQKLPGDPVLEPDGIALNDMDFYVYTDPPTFEEAQKRGATADSEDDPYLTNGATQGLPEKAFLFKPKGDYLLTVINYLGANTGYNLKLTWVSESFPSPFESLAPELAPPTTRPTPTTRPVVTTTTLPPVTTPPRFDAPPPTLAPLGAIIDDDFATAAFDTSGFDDQLSAPTSINLAPIVSNPDPPSGLALLFWMLAVPLSLTAVFGTVVLRRRATLATI